MELGLKLHIQYCQLTIKSGLVFGVILSRHALKYFTLDSVN